MVENSNPANLRGKVVYSEILNEYHKVIVSCKLRQATDFLLNTLITCLISYSGANLGE